MIQDFRSLSDCGFRRSCIPERSLELRLSRELARKTVWDAAFDPAGDTRRTAIVDSKVFDSGFLASGLKRSPNIISYPKHQIIGRE